MPSTYNFQYHAQNLDSCNSEFPAAKSINTSIDFDAATTWPTVLNEFITFLSSVYGYDISKHVDVQTFEQRIAAYNNED